MTIAAFALLIVLFVIVVAWATDDDRKPKRNKRLPEQSEKYGRCPETCPFLLKTGIGENGFVHPCFCARYDTAMWTTTTHTVAFPDSQPEQECYAPRECDIAHEANLARKKP
jgi:hypothetical protein